MEKIMGDMNSIRETSPEFLIAEAASPEQRAFLIGLQERILAEPDIYDRALTAYQAATNPDRIRKEPLRDITGGLLDFIGIGEDSAIRAQASSDWRELLHGTNGATSKLEGFDPTTEEAIQAGGLVRSANSRRSTAKNEKNDKKVEAITEEIRTIRLRKFLSRAAIIKSQTPDENENDDEDEGNDESFGLPA